MTFIPEYAHLSYYASGVFQMRELSWKSTMSFDQNIKIFSKEKENIACKMSAILSWLPCINLLKPSDAYIRRRQAIIWTNAGISLIGPLGTNFSEILIWIHIFSVKKMHLKMLSGKWRPFCLGLNVLTMP